MKAFVHRRILQKTARRFLLGTFVAACLAGCGKPEGNRAPQTSTPETGTVTAYVVNYPLKYLAERIGGARARVIFPAPPDRDPVYWIPSGKEISEFQQADVILLNGAGYAKWIGMASLPTSRVLDTSAKARDQYIPLEGSLTHSHGPEGEHAHGGVASTTWLDLELALFQAGEICRTFTQLRPQHAAEFRDNLSALQRDFNALDSSFSSLIKGENDRPVVFSHPVFQYLTRRYELDAVSVHWEPNEFPSDANWEQLKSTLQEHPARWMIWESAADESIVTALDELGVKSTVFDPCANVPKEGDFLEVMHRNFERLRAVYEQPPEEK